MTVTSLIPTLEPTEYARRTIGLPGDRGTVELTTGRVYNEDGAYVTTLPAHTVALLAPAEAPTVTQPTEIRRRSLLTRWLRLA